jgi:quinol monooxygenase YgiN
MALLAESVAFRETLTWKHVLIIHEVIDYPLWKKVFDASAVMRKAAGEHSYQILRYQEDANKIVHFSAWSSHASARHFFQSPELENIRQQAGVKAPDFIYLNQLETGVL